MKKGGSKLGKLMNVKNLVILVVVVLVCVLVVVYLRNKKELFNFRGQGSQRGSLGKIMVLNTYLQQEYIEKYIALLYCVSIWDRRNDSDDSTESKQNKLPVNFDTDDLIAHVKNLYENDLGWAYSGNKINNIYNIFKDSSKDGNGDIPSRDRCFTQVILSDILTVANENLGDDNLLFGLNSRGRPRKSGGRNKRKICLNKHKKRARIKMLGNDPDNIAEKAQFLIGPENAVKILNGFIESFKGTNEGKFINYVNMPKDDAFLKQNDIYNKMITNTNLSETSPDFV